MRPARRLIQRVLAAAAVACVLGSVSPVRAQPKSAAAPAPVTVKISATAMSDLKSGDEAKIRGALDEIRLAGRAAGAPFAAQIAILLHAGLPAPIAVAALDTVADLEAESASPVIAEYMQHRNVHVRQAATKALVKTKGAFAVRALIHALSDRDAMVRGFAADGLGQLKARTAVADLLLALDHRVNEAAGAIGILCSAQECEQLAARIGRFPFDVMAAGIGELFFRLDAADDTKIKVLGRVRELGTHEANKFLLETAKKWPSSGSARFKQALDQAVQATGGGS